MDIKEGRKINFDSTPPPPKANVPGGPGSPWRMMRLRKVYEAAKEEGLDAEILGAERFGSLQAFEEAKEERRILDEREGKRAERGRVTDSSWQGKDGEKRLMFTEVGGSGSSSRSSSFRRPGGIPGSGPSTPTPPDMRPLSNRRVDSLRLPSQANSPLAQSHTPVPSVMSPSSMASGSRRALSPSSLNKLQAKVLRAKLTGMPDAEKLEKEYEAEARRANGELDSGGDVRRKVEVLPTLDARGRMYDVGHGRGDEEARPGNRKKKEEKVRGISLSVLARHYPDLLVRNTRSQNWSSHSYQCRRRHSNIGRDVEARTHGRRYGRPEELGCTVCTRHHGRWQIPGRNSQTLFFFVD